MAQKAQQGTSFTGHIGVGTLYAIDPATGQIVPSASATGIGGPAPAARTPGTSESYPHAGGAPGTTSTTPVTPTAAVSYDWRQYLADWGFEKADMDQLDRIFRSADLTSQSGIDTATKLALAYIRGTQWYAKTFPGIQAGEKVGLFSDELGYRAYLNDVNQVYRRMFGRDITGQETSDYLSKGWSSTQIGQHLVGQATVNTNLPQYQYQLGAFGDRQATPDEVSALGDQTGGLDNQLGMQVQNKIQVAQQRLQRIMTGTLANPSLSILNGGRAASSAIAGKTGDYAA